MIIFVTGKPGGGKSYYAVSLIIDALINTERMVCTNLELCIPELRAYLQQKHDVAIDLWRRLRILKDEEMLTFYLHRQNGVDIAPVTQQDERAGRYPRMGDKPADDPGVLYVLDEVHTWFHARNWQNVGLSILWYQGQHRHLNDEIFFLTQNPEQVDKQFRALAQYWLILTNHTYELSIKGFRGRKNQVSVCWYNELPPRNSWMTRKMAAKTDSFQLDLPPKKRKPDDPRLYLADCYKTAKSSLGGKGPEERRIVGRSPLWAVAGVLVLLALATCVPWLIRYLSVTLTDSLAAGPNKAISDMMGLPPGDESKESDTATSRPARPVCIAQWTDPDTAQPVFVMQVGLQTYRRALQEGPFVWELDPIQLAEYGYIKSSNILNECSQPPSY